MRSRAFRAAQKIDRRAAHKSCARAVYVRVRRYVARTASNARAGKRAEKGAYIVESDENPDVILVASGSEVATLEEGAVLLRAEGIRVRIVSVPSEGLFRCQSKAYQESVIPAGSKVFGLTAGLPVTLESLVGPNGKVWGLESFGFSAPYKVLDEKLGFTGQNVYNQVKELLA